MNFLSRLFSPPKPLHGEPITLVFKCGDEITNARPPVVPVEVRIRAVEQSGDTRCPMCQPNLWMGLDHDDTLPEMRAMLRDAWNV